MMQNNSLPPVPSNCLLINVWRAFLHCLHKDNYARLWGRAGVFEYWSASLTGTILCLLPSIFFLVQCIYIQLVALIIILSLLIYLAMPLYSVFVRRLHDINCSGWWILIYYLSVAILTICGSFYVSQHLFLYEIDTENIYSQLLTIFPDWFSNLTFLVDIQSIIFLVLTLIPGNKEKNKYGESV